MAGVWSLLEELLMPWTDRQQYDGSSEEIESGPTWTNLKSLLTPSLRMGVVSLHKPAVREGAGAGCVASNTSFDVNSLLQVRNPGTQVLWKDSKHSLLLSRLSSPQLNVFLMVFFRYLHFDTSEPWENKQRRCGSIWGSQCYRQAGIKDSEAQRTHKLSPEKRQYLD